MAQTWEKLADLHELTQKLKSSGALLTKPVPGAEKPAPTRIVGIAITTTAASRHT
jgi:hypothetical protein